MPLAKRDLGKLGIRDVDQLENPLRPGIRVEAKVALRKDDDGNEYNRLRSFRVIGMDDDPTLDPDFSPKPTNGNDQIGLNIEGAGAAVEAESARANDHHAEGDDAEGGQQGLIHAPPETPNEKGGLPDA